MRLEQVVSRRLVRLLRIRKLDRKGKANNMAQGDAGISVRTDAPDTGTAPKARTSRPAEAKSAVDYLGLTAQGSKLRKDGEEFVAKVVEETAKYDVDLKVTKIPDNNYEARVLSANGLAVVLIFHDTFVAHDKMNIPSVSVTKDIIRSLEIKGVNDQIISVIVVTPDLYPNFDRMAVSIVNTFRAANEATFKDMAIGDIKASGEIHVNLNLKEVISYAETTTGSPVAHADSGLIVYAKQRVKGNGGYSINDDVKTIAIGAVTGYTEFKRVPVTAQNVGAAGVMCQYKYDPTFVVTGVYSPIRTDEFAAFLVAVAHDVFISRGLWINAFSSFAEGERNFGALFVDPQTKKPYKVQNFQQRWAIMQQHFTSSVPLFAIDLQEGRDQFPGLKKMLANPEQFKEIIASFTGDEAIRDIPLQQGDDVVQYDGFVETNKGRLDTRAVDYLFLVDPKGGNVNADRAAPFLDYADPHDPRAIEKKAAQLQEFYQKVDLTYTTHRIYFNPDFSDTLAKSFAASVPVTIDSFVNNQVYDFSGFRRKAPGTGAAFQSGVAVGPAWGGVSGYAY